MGFAWLVVLAAWFVKTPFCLL